jgi:hypothetical protein
MPALGESRESNKGFGFLKADGNQGQLEGNRADRGHQLQCHFQLFRTGLRSLRAFSPRRLLSSLLRCWQERE